MHNLITLQGVSAQHPPWVAHRAQPMGGLIDAFLASADSPDELAYWHEMWSSVKGPDGKIIEDARKGYLEVSL
ncbi:hypothetical protein RM780_22335 [Streptomyces sp. DSM 44917]|uniref:Uncharacterized protein n=2 Tax=Streptomyces boetiae TaxID=3075541 RepID=A0ABU2LDK8_9ACTN|nr:hypothetical protein [Streptomyces sp. DSM 44917]MDT0309674.1 hypothetical protein [Streptomyces sp. DSM 44917]